MTDRLSAREWGMIAVAVAISPLLPLVWRFHSMREQVKTAIALAAAWSIGIWTGINYMGSLIDPKSINGSAPAWVATAESMAMNAVFMAAMCTVAWIMLDYRYS